MPENDELDLLDENVAEEPSSNSADSGDEDFDYDENGYVIIPEDADDEGKTGPAEATTNATANEAQPSEYERRYLELEAQVKDSLSKLGVSESDPLRGLAKLAADEDGLSIDDYLKKRASEKEKEDALRIVRAQQFQEKAARDLAELKASFGQLESCKDIRDIPNFDKWYKFRDAGLTAKEAFAAANPDGIREAAANASKQTAIRDAKSHLQSSAPKAAAEGGARLTRSEMQQYREMFPKLSDKEIVKLYRKTE